MINTNEIPEKTHGGFTSWDHAQPGDIVVTGEYMMIEATKGRVALCILTMEEYTQLQVARGVYPEGTTWES